MFLSCIFFFFWCCSLIVVLVMVIFCCCCLIVVLFFNIVTLVKKFKITLEALMLSWQNAHTTPSWSMSVFSLMNLLSFQGGGYHIQPLLTKGMVFLVVQHCSIASASLLHSAVVFWFSLQTTACPRLLLSPFIGTLVTREITEVSWWVDCGLPPNSLVAV